jgi:sulfane dehydrogenase subunit SoxC
MGDTTLPRAAGNGLIDRRALLRLGATALCAAPIAGLGQASRNASAPGRGDNDGATHALLRPPSMATPGRPFTNYGQPSEYEKRVLRWVSADSGAPGNGVSWSPLHLLEGSTTPNGLHFERHHNGVPDIDPSRHELYLHGMLRRPLAFDIDRLMRYPMTTRRCFIECGGNSNACWNSEPVQAATGHVHGLASCAEWTGIPVATLLDEAGVAPGAKWAIAEGADGFALSMSIPVDKLLDDALLALYQNGERLRPENGYPLRLVLPGWEGVLNVKWLRRLHLTDRPAMGRNETARYTELQPSGTARMFTFIMQSKSLVTWPSSGMLLPRHGLYEIKGLAWSGNGSIRRVEVSADGGHTWADALLDEPVLSKCFTRFRIPWHWQGQRAVLKSRATDTDGNVQPERADLLSRHGRHGYYHYNAIVAFAVDPDGIVSHVYA